MAALQFEVATPNKLAMNNPNKEANEKSFVVNIRDNHGSLVFSNILAVNKEGAIDAVMQTRYGVKWQESQVGKVRIKVTEWR